MTANAGGRRWVWAMGAEVIGRSGPLATFLLYFPLIGESPAGLALAAYAFSMTGWLLIDLGLGLYGTALVSEDPGRASLTQREITRARVMLAVLVVPALGLLIHYVLEAPWPMVLGFVGFLLFRACSVDWRLRGEGRFPALARASLWGTVAQIALVGLLVREGNWEVTAGVPFAGWGLGMLIATWLTPPEGAVAVGPHITARVHLSRSLGYSLTNGASTLFGQMPIIALAAAHPPSYYASFALLHRIVTSINLLFVALGASVFPDLVRALRSGHGSARQINAFVVRVTVLTGAVISVVMALVYAVPVVRSTYLSGLSVVVFLAFTAFMIVRSVRESTLRLILASGQTVDSAKMTTIVVAMFAAVLAALGSFGLLSTEVASMTFLVAETGLFVLLFRVSRRTLINSTRTNS